MTPLQLLDAKNQEPEIPRPFLATSQELERGGNLANSTIQQAGEFPRLAWLGSQKRRELFGAPSRRETELRWRRTHREALRPFLGQWIVLEGERIIASGHSLVEAVREARALDIRVPYVFRVEDLDENTATIGL
jgi:hypothetical protein